MEEKILKDKVRLYYKNYNFLGYMKCAECYIDKRIFCKHVSQRKVQNKLKKMKEKLHDPIVFNDPEITYLKRLPFKESKKRIVKLNIEIPEHDRISTIVNGMSNEKFYNSISKVIELPQKPDQILTQEIQSYDQNEKNNFIIYHLIEYDELKGYNISEPFSTISYKRLYKGNPIKSSNKRLYKGNPVKGSNKRLYKGNPVNSSKGNPAKVDKYYNLYLQGKSNIIFYYLESIFEKRNTPNEELKFKKEIKFNIKFFNLETLNKYQDIPLSKPEFQNDSNTFVPVNIQNGNDQIQLPYPFGISQISNNNMNEVYNDNNIDNPLTNQYLVNDIHISPLVINEHDITLYKPQNTNTPLCLNTIQNGMDKKSILYPQSLSSSNINNINCNLELDTNASQDISLLMPEFHNNNNDTFIPLYIQNDQNNNGQINNETYNDIGSSLASEYLKDIQISLLDINKYDDITLNKHQISDSSLYLNTIQNEMNEKSILYPQPLPSNDNYNINNFDLNNSYPLLLKAINPNEKYTENGINYLQQIFLQNQKQISYLRQQLLLQEQFQILLQQLLYKLNNPDVL
ncbi:hypothetical protein PIROE2DRAFT_14594 [Piromyces sp. E2]|nr:hypothetical protein PIROE2DRAFT_14594 [Piromyces sp. E2]|eukprot:OUM59795.1 hypothetical protein PIROE2DRAFT_14594 [Piromyces sp. E2]